MTDTARLPPDGMTRLVEAARTAPGLRAPLSRHPALTAELGAVLYAWVGKALREALIGRFDLDPAMLNEAMDEAVQAATDQPFGRPVRLERPEEREAMEQRLIEKLDSAGQLKPGYLLRALREHNLSLFEIGLSRLAGVALDDLRRVPERAEPRAGIERRAPQRGHGGGRPGRPHVPGAEPGRGGGGLHPHDPGRRAGLTGI